MDEVLQFLTDNPTFYLATVDGNIPKVRPFGFVMKFEENLYFCTSNKKNVFRQLQANPHFEVSTTSKTADWLRLKGKAVFNTNKHTKQAAINAMPFLGNMYSVEDSVFELFYIEDGEATFNTIKGVSKTVTL